MRPLGVDDPTRIGDYRLFGLLGAGGMGRVYLGRNMGGRTVAVKVIRPDLIDDAQSRERFRREVAAARLVGGRFTAPVLDADVDADPPWLATGYVAGFSLTDAVEQFGSFTEHTLLVLARGLVEALIAVHSAGIVHRDLKPSNVLLAVDGPKVIDFGIARAVTDAHLTTTGKVIGSPGFMCPEQITGDPVGPASDVFALGGVLVFAASGHGPFGAGDTMQMLWRVMYEEPQLDSVPERLRPLVTACLSKEVDGRPTTEQLLAELTNLEVPQRGWLPAPVLEEVSRRAVRLLDLDTGPNKVDRYAAETMTPTALSDPSGPRLFTDPSQPRPVMNPSWQQTTPTAGLRPPGTSGGQPSSGQFAQYPPAASQSWPQDAVGAYGPHPAPAMHPQHPDAQQGTPPRSRRRTAIITGLIVACVLAAVGTFLIGKQLTGKSDGGRSVTVSVTSGDSGGTTSSTSGPSLPSVPKAFVGQWRGTASDGPVRFEIELTIRDGKLGEEVATSSNTGVVSRERCGRAERLTNATEAELTFTARLTSGTSCNDEGQPSTVKLQADGSVSYSTPGVFGGTIVGNLRKS
ncbi:serine/threonine-protein kinase [Nocardia sp. NPDC052566]|uniref:serine/threonine-protein kinase n=1 Tax=Nocardia sp. NPDC052566 TaxID=3364330 RepID=UPI0037CBCA73